MTTEEIINLDNEFSERLRMIQQMVNSLATGDIVAMREVVNLVTAGHITREHYDVVERLLTTLTMHALVAPGSARKNS